MDITDKYVFSTDSTKAAGFDILTTACMLEDQLRTLEAECDIIRGRRGEKWKRAVALEDELISLMARERCEKEITATLERTVASDGGGGGDSPYNALDTTTFSVDQNALANQSLPSIYSNEDGLDVVASQFSELTTITTISDDIVGPVKFQQKSSKGRQQDLVPHSVEVNAEVKSPMALYAASVPPPEHQSAVMTEVLPRKASVKRRKNKKKRPSTAVTADPAASSALSVNSALLNGMELGPVSNEVSILGVSWNKGKAKRSFGTTRGKPSRNKFSMRL